MNVIVVGCGRVGAELAHRLFQRGHTVVVIDQEEDAFQNLPLDFRGRTVVGEILNQEVLRRAGMDEADALAAVTSSDSANAVIAHIARSVYEIPNVVVRNFDSRWRTMHEVFGLQVISSSSWGAQRIEELLYQQEARTVFSAGNGEVEVYELVVPDDWDGRLLNDLLPARNDCVPVALTRGGRAFMPSGEYPLAKGDILLVSATLEGSQALLQNLRNGPPTSRGKEG